ncbi:hypothetical protein EBZ39_00835 [bacterium]|nr:hypothetical protein [bacterium]
MITNNSTRKPYRRKDYESFKARHGEEDVKRKMREYYLKHKALKRDRIRERYYEYMERSPDAKIKLRLRSRIIGALKSAGTRKNKKTTELLGCDIMTARKHIEAQFKEGMSWDNYANNTWHIDHIRPCASFDLTDPEQQKQCFHYTNLQPLWAWENDSKGSFYNGIRHRYNKGPEV